MCVCVCDEKIRHKWADREHCIYICHTDTLLLENWHCGDEPKWVHALALLSQLV